MRNGSVQLTSASSDSASFHVSHHLQRHFRDRIPDSTTSLSELYPDSLELIESLFELEQQTGKTLSNLELKSLKTLGDLIRFFSAPAKRQE